MRVSAPGCGVRPPWIHTLAAHTQLQAASHQSSPTARPVPPPDPVNGDTVVRRPSRHTFDIRV